LLLANTNDPITEIKVSSFIPRRSQQKDNSESFELLASPYPNQTTSDDGLEERIFKTHPSKTTNQKSKGKDLKV
jgi:hypothetical protein